MSRQARCLTLLLAGHLLLAVAFSMLTPLGEAPDEADHWAYVVHLATVRALPEGPRITQSKHPPLYHGSAALVASIASPSNDFLRANPDVQIHRRDPWAPNFFIHTTLESFPWRGGVLSFHLARLWSALLSTLTVWATFALGRALFLEQPAVAWGGAALLAFLPEFAFIGGSVNNDNGVALFGTLTLLAGARLLNSNGSLRRLWWAPLAVGAGLLNKTSALGVWPALSLAITWSLVRADVTRTGSTLARLARCVRSHWRRGLIIHLFLFGGGLLLAAPWLLRNHRLYGDPLGVALAIQTIDLRTTAWTGSDTLWLMRGWFLSFTGRLGGAGHIPLPGWVAAGYGLIAGLGLTGLIVYSWRQRRQLAWLPVAILLLAIGGVMIGIWRYSLVALGTDQGRLLYPAVAPIVLTIAAGMLALLPRQAAGRAVQAMIGWGLLSSLAAIMWVLIPAFAPLPAASAESVAAHALATPIAFEELSLVGWQPQPEPILYWQLSMKTRRDLRTTLRIVAEDGTLVWEKRRSPGLGLQSTDHWDVTRVVRDVYTIEWPEWAQPGRYQLEVSVQPFGEETITVAGGTRHLLGWIEKPE